MDDFYWRSHVPAFGSWDCYDDLPFTQCFDTATQPGLLRYNGYSEDRDLYVAGHLYDNDVVTPAMIVDPRRPGKIGYSNSNIKKEKQGKKEDACLESPASPVRRRPPAKAVDEDLYKISPHLLRQQPRRRGGWGIFFKLPAAHTCWLKANLKGLFYQ